MSDNRGVVNWAELQQAASKNDGKAYINNPLDTEVRVKDPKSGGEKGAKLARFSLIPPDFLLELANHYGRGARKYADRNWERGYKWSLSVDALERHLTAFKMGEWLDSETGTPHIIAVAWHCAALFIFKTRGLGTNDIYYDNP